MIMAYSERLLGGATELSADADVSRRETCQRWSDIQ